MCYFSCGSGFTCVCELCNLLTLNMCMSLCQVYIHKFFFENTSRGLLKYYFSVSEQSASSGLWVEIFLEVYPHKLKFKWFVLIYVLLVFEVVYLKLNIVSL